MKNVYNIIKTSSSVSKKDIISAIQQVFVKIRIGEPKIFGKEISPRVHQVENKYHLRQDDPVNYRLDKNVIFNEYGVAVDPSILTQQQKNEAIKYKNDKKAILSQIRSPSGWELIDQQFERIIKLFQQIDPTFKQNSQNTFGGKYADIILNIYKHEKHIPSYRIPDLRSFFLDIERYKHMYQSANLQFPDIRKINSISQLYTFIGYFRDLQLSIFQIVDVLKVMYIFNSGIDITTFRQDGTRSVQRYRDSTNLPIWLLRVSEVQNQRIGQDRDSIQKNLLDFIALVSKGKIKINRQIKDNTYDQIVTKVASFQENLPDVQPTKDSRLILNILKPEAESGIYKLYKSSDPLLIQQIGFGTTWCTRKQMGSNSYATRYIQKQGCIYFVTRDNKIILQMLPTMSQFMDINNRDVSTKIFQWADQDLKNVLIPYFKRVMAQGMVIDQLGSPSNVQMGNNYRKVIKQFIPNSVHKVDEFNQQVYQIANDRLQAGNSDYALKIINSFIPQKRNQFTYKLVECLIKQQQYNGAIQLAMRNNIPLARYSQQFNQSYLNAMNRGMKTITGLIYDITNIFKRNKISINQQLLQKMRDTILLQLDSHAIMQSKQTQSYLKAFTQLGLDMAPMKQKIENIIIQQLNVTNIFTFSKLVTRDIKQIIQLCRKYNVHISPLIMKQPILRQIRNFSAAKDRSVLAGDPLIRLVSFVINRPAFGISKQNILAVINKNLYPDYYQQIQNLVSNKVLANINWYKKVINA